MPSTQLGLLLLLLGISWSCFLVGWGLFGPFVLCACVPASAYGSWLPSFPPFSAASDSIRPVRFVDPIRGGPGATPTLLARGMLPSHTTPSTQCTSWPAAHLLGGELGRNVEDDLGEWEKGGFGWGGKGVVCRMITGSSLPSKAC
jgi:hypothetical protein